MKTSTLLQSVIDLSPNRPLQPIQTGTVYLEYLTMNCPKCGHRISRLGWFHYIGIHEIGNNYYHIFDIDDADAVLCPGCNTGYKAFPYPADDKSVTVHFYTKPLLNKEIE